MGLVYMLVMCGSVTSAVISAVPCCSFVVENIRVSPLSRTFLLNCRNCGYTAHTHTHCLDTGETVETCRVF